MVSGWWCGVRRLRSIWDRNMAGRLLRVALRPGFWPKLSTSMMPLPACLPLSCSRQVFYHTVRKAVMAVSLMITEGARDSESGTALLSHIYKVGRHLQVALTMESQPLSTRPALVDIQMDGAPVWL